MSKQTDEVPSDEERRGYGIGCLRAGKVLLAVAGLVVVWLIVKGLA
jgi:hypothetical protein